MLSSVFGGRIDVLGWYVAGSICSRVLAIVKKNCSQKCFPTLVKSIDGVQVDLPQGRSSLFHCMCKWQHQGCSLTISGLHAHVALTRESKKMNDFWLFFFFYSCSVASFSGCFLWLFSRSFLESSGHSLWYPYPHINPWLVCVSIYQARTHSFALYYPWA